VVDDNSPDGTAVVVRSMQRLCTAGQLVGALSTRCLTWVPRPRLASPCKTDCAAPVAAAAAAANTVAV
jgi:hypothetical protein